MFLLPCEGDNDLAIMSDLLDMALKTHTHFITDPRTIHRRAHAHAHVDGTHGTDGDGRGRSVSFFNVSKGVVDVEKQAFAQTSTAGKIHKLEKQLQQQEEAARRGAEGGDGGFGSVDAAKALVRWSAWKCSLAPCRPSHPETPTPLVDAAKALVDAAVDREIEVLYTSPWPLPRPTSSNPLVTPSPTPPTQLQVLKEEQRQRSGVMVRS